MTLFSELWDSLARQNLQPSAVLAGTAQLAAGVAGWGRLVPRTHWIEELDPREDPRAHMFHKLEVFALYFIAVN